MYENLASRAYAELYGKEPPCRMEIRYHAGFKGFNANVRKAGGVIQFNLSRRFESCEPEVQLGVMQFLLNKLNRTKVKSEHIEFYHTFLRNMSDLAPVTESDPILEASFRRMNERYLGGMMARPNLVWGRSSVRLLGTYTYATDTIMISRVLEQAPEELLDYVMYHEMLHKKHKFSCTNTRTHSHTKEFRADEAKYHVADAEMRLRRFLSRAPRAVRRDGKTLREEPSFVERVMGWL